MLTHRLPLYIKGGILYRIRIFSLKGIIASFS